MQIGMFVNGCSTTVKLIVDDAEQAIVFSGHIAKGAPDGVVVSHEGSTVTVLRTFETEKAAEDWARGATRGYGRGFSV